MIGTRVGNYEIVRELARGGMAVVYLARQPALDRMIALKRLEISSGHPSLAHRFVDEARVVARLDHPNIVTVHDFCEHEGLPYIAMEYVSGGSLRPRVKGLGLAQTLAILDDLLAALEHAAEHHITHRDLKPENVLVTPRGTVKVADFGIALAHDAVSRLTTTGATMGTPVYMAPEQARDGEVDPRTDLYALGVMAYEMLAGRPPFPGGDQPVAILYRHTHEPVPPLRGLAPDVSPALAEWVERLLAKDKGDRPASAREARRALERIAVAELGPYWRRRGSLAPGATSETLVAPTATIATTRDAVAASAPPPGRRGRLPLLAGAAVAAAALAAAGVAALAGDEPRSKARRETRRAATQPAVPFAFGPGATAHAVAGLPGWTMKGRPGHSGAVLVASPRGAPRPIGPDALGRQARDAREGQFGAAVASGDFDRDGHADLAIGAPTARAGLESGRPGAVAVIRGSARGLRRAVKLLLGPDDHAPAGRTSYGASLAAGDLDRDGFTDLVVGAPDADPFPIEDGGSGTITLLFGGPGGLKRDGARTIRRLRAVDADFGRRVALGDVNHDGHQDLVEAADGRSHFCRGTRTGPRRCSAMGGGATALAVADMTGDGRGEVVHGFAPDGSTGVLRIFRGTARGPAREPITITQDDPHLPGHVQAGDRFGAALGAADLDRDGYADVLVGSPGEDDGSRAPHARPRRARRLRGDGQPHLRAGRAGDPRRQAGRQRVRSRPRADRPQRRRRPRPGDRRAGRGRRRHAVAARVDHAVAVRRTRAPHQPREPRRPRPHQDQPRRVSGEGLHRSTPGEHKARLEAERSGAPFLLYRDGDGAQRIVRLDPDRPRLYVGRQPDVDIALPWDTEVSRIHADLERIGGVWTVVDDGRSRNGSFVNGERLYGRRTLRHGDVVAVGRTRIAFVDPRAEAVQSTAVASGDVGPAVSPAQRRVLVALCRPVAHGNLAVPPSNRQLAEELVVSVDTVKSHLHALFESFGLEDVPQHHKRAELARQALQRGVVSERELT